MKSLSVLSFTFLLSLSLIPSFAQQADIEIEEAKGTGLSILRADLYGLQIHSSGDHSIRILDSDQSGIYIVDATKNGIHIHNAQQNAIYAHGQNAAAILDGRVGIGIGSPLQQLHIHNKVESAPAYIKITNDQSGANASDGLDIGIEGTGEANISMLENKAMKFATYNATRMTILGNGRLGFGTSSPQQQIHSHLGTTGSSNFLKITNSTSGSSSSDGLDLGIEGSGDAILWMKENRALKLATNNSTRIIILPNGNVGVGENNPEKRLHLNGDIKVEGEVNRPATGEANLVPICYGLVNNEGTILGGTGNFSVELGTGLCQFLIDIDGIEFSFLDGSFAVLVTAQGGSASYGSVGLSTLTIKSSNVLGCSNFSFLVYRL